MCPPLLLSCLLICLGCSAAQTTLPNSAVPDSAAALPVTTRSASNLHPENSKLLVILIDGLRWDAINTSHIHHGEGCAEGCVDAESFFTTVQRVGATAAYNNPVFPTTPTPNWNTIASGLLPMSHGVLSDTGRTLETAGLTPIWESSVSSGKKTALIGWTSCDGVTTDPLLICTDRISLSGAANLLVQLTGDAALAAELLVAQEHSLVMMRTSLVYWASEHVGPKSKFVRRMMAEMEAVLEELFLELRNAGIWDKVSVVLVSGNGQTSTRPAVSRPVRVEECLTAPVHYRYSSAGSAILIPPEHTTAEQMVEQLEKCEEFAPGTASWYQKTELPPVDQWAGGNNEVLLVASEGFALRDVVNRTSGRDLLYSEDGDLQLARAELPRGPAGGRGRMAGDGYDTANLDMNAVFIAKGPGVVRGVTGASILQTDVYQVLCHLAGLQPQLHHGQWDTVDWMMVPSACSTMQPTHHAIVASLMLIYTLYYVLQ
uniref:Ectonucleotide pyrophosphatase/phosphodiesterase family member 6-like n=1 Tax=Hirondellea gigas TaxID=1518452 RepID=A0A6A7G2F6_9CRUS